MNPKIFAKVFSDIKKQSQTQSRKRKANTSAKQTKQNERSDQNEESREQGRAIVEQRMAALDKKISKQPRQSKETKLKKWKNDLYNKLQLRKEEYGKKSRTIQVENIAYEEILSLLKDYKIHIEEISGYEVVLANEKIANQCLSILKNKGLTARRADQKQVEQISDKKTTIKQSSIFQRIK